MKQRFYMPGSRVLRRYGLAVVAVAVALGVRWLLDPVLQTYAPYLPFTLAVLVAGRFGGRGPWLAATAAGVLCSWYFLLEPRFIFSATPAQPASLALFSVVGASISLLTGQLRQALDISRRGESQLRRFPEFASVAIAMFDREMRYLAVSERFKQDYGLEGKLGRAQPLGTVSGDPGALAGGPPARAGGSCRGS